MFSGNVKAIKVVGVDLEIMKVVRILNLFYYIPLKIYEEESLKKFGHENPQYDSVITSIIEK